MKVVDIYLHFGEKLLIITCRTRETPAASWKNCKKENPGSKVDYFLLQLEDGTGEVHIKR